MHHIDVPIPLVFSKVLLPIIPHTNTVAKIKKYCKAPNGLPSDWCTRPRVIPILVMMSSNAEKFPIENVFCRSFVSVQGKNLGIYSPQKV